MLLSDRVDRITVLMYMMRVVVVVVVVVVERERRVYGLTNVVRFILVVVVVVVVCIVVAVCFFPLPLQDRMVVIVRVSSLQSVVKIVEYTVHTFYYILLSSLLLSSVTD